MRTWNICVRTCTLHSLPHVQNTVQSCIVADNYTEAKSRKYSTHATFRWLHKIQKYGITSSVDATSVTHS